MIDESQIEYLLDGERAEADVLNRPLRQIVRATNTSLANISGSGGDTTEALDTALDEIHEEISTTSDNLTLLIEERYDDVSTRLGLKVDKVVGKVLSDTNFTQAEKDKLSSLEGSKFVGLFVSEGSLPATGSAGDYANVDGGVGRDVYRVIWDSSDKKWVRAQGISVDLTDAQIKQQYEGNPDTNAFTDDQKTKLTGITVGATKNRADTLNADKTHTHTTAQVTGLDTTLGSKVDKTTQVIAGTGLSGGGTLAENRTLNVSYGTTSGTAAQGNDSRITDALQKSQVVQTTGTSATNVMSQKVTTDALNTKAPSTHTHSWSQVTEQPVTATRWPTFAEVSGKPTSYSTTWASVDAKPDTATRWPTFAEVTGKPLTDAEITKLKALLATITVSGTAVTFSDTVNAKDVYIRG